jgi:hypothetical protein
MQSREGLAEGLVKRPHIVTSEEPIREGSGVTAHCGEPIAKAAFAFAWDGDIMGHYDLRLGGCCRKCCAADLSDRRYVYGVVEAQEAMLERRESEE